MKKYYCDVCGAPMPEDYLGSITKQHGSVEQICSVDDVCPKCLFVGSEMDPKQVLLDEWKRLVKAKAKADQAPKHIASDLSTGHGGENSTGDAVSFGGRGAFEKREIYAMLLDYRQKVGLGGLGPLCDATGFSDTKVMNMLNGQKYPMSDWRQLGKALQKEMRKMSKSD